MGKVKDDLNISNNQTLENCTYIRAIVMLIIVLNHCMCIYRFGGGWTFAEAKSDAPVIFGWITTWFSTFMNYTFVIVSGYVYYAMKFEKGKYQTFFPFIWKKIQRLLIPTIFISVVWIIPVYCFLWKPGIHDVIYNFALGVFPRQLWFMLMLFWVFLIFAPFSKIIDKHFLFGVVFIMLCYCVGIFGSAFTNGVNYYRVFDGCKFVLYFWIGFILRKYGLNFLLKIPSVIYILINILLMLINKLFDPSIIRPHMLASGVQIILPVMTYISGGIMAFTVLQKILNKLDGEHKILKFFGKYSLSIYMIHEELVYFAIYWYEGKISPFLFVPLTFFWVLIVSLAISVLLNKSKITGFLVNGKI